MKFPMLTEIQSSRQMVDVFAGYNHNLRINDGEFYDMKNLTSSHYPALSPRDKRGTYISVSNPLGMIAKDSLCYVDNGKLYINKNEVEGLDLNSEEKTLVSMGAYIIILPDKKWVNTENTSKYGSIDATFDSNPWVKFTLCQLDGTDYGEGFHGEGTAPENPVNGQFWLDTSSKPNSLKVYSSSTSTWTAVATTYVKIESPNIDLDFEVYDGINISGLGREIVLKDYSDGHEIVGTTRDQLADLNGSAVVWAKGKDYIVVVGILDEVTTISNTVTITRKMPEVDFLIESQNRLWGCKYGVVNGETVNEIYACKQGDFKNWNCFMGVSTDSYVASCGTDGKFTGAITHLGYPLFFKEGFMHKVYGNYPANYQIQTTACRGVQKGCNNSLAIVNEVLYYKSRNGVVAYDGSLPTEMSNALGDMSYSNAVACGHGNKYYISMSDESNKYHLFVYDTKKGVWHREDDLQVDMFCSCRNELYFVQHDVKAIKTLFGSGIVDTAPVEWMAETGPLVTYSPDKKYISRLNVRMSLAIGTVVHFYIQYDSAGEWHHASTMTGTVLRPFSVPIRPRRCDHFKIRIVGVGEAKIHSITKTIEQGSDI